MKKIVSGLLTILITSPALVNASGVESPLNPNYSSIPNFISGVLQIMVQIGLPIVALFLLIAGYKFAAAGGSPSKLNEAKENFMYVIIGALLILGAWVLATLIGNTVTQLVGQ